ncbi:AraC family transcriptional regulator [Bifidobacterium felsineum]|uniref:AraC family transcriptional regulator n=1 Tax=Bifidobacterium felsineum TaxID=2045440 RepID=A0A2M9HKE7_9BIFI|nr:AraC family transcriptional regulator [Bifidobacterium felsineum]PJM77277.1 AraC family transcriptional regulator [Bifidobacterium felsineum]
MAEDSIYYILRPTHVIRGLGFSFCGISQPKPGYGYGPAMRSAYTIYLVIEGEGRLISNGMQYHLNRNEGFIIRPDDGASFITSQAHPWTYLWLGFNGENAEYYLAALGLARGHDTLRVKNALEFLRIIVSCLSHSRSTPEDELKLNSLTYEFLHQLSEQIVSETVPGMNLAYGEITRRTMDYIADHYLEPIGVNEVAAQLNMNRSYLSREFRRESGLTIKDYINRIRVTKASDLLMLTDMSLNEIAKRCGYGSVEVLTKQFKTIYAMTPARYRQQRDRLHNDTEINLNFLRAILG